MAETDFIPTKAARFRTSRYPGFVGGGTDPVTGNLRPSFLTLNPNPSQGEALTEADDPPKPSVTFNGLRRFQTNPVGEHEAGESERLATEGATREQRYQLDKALSSPLGVGLSDALHESTAGQRGTQSNP